MSKGERPRIVEVIEPSPFAFGAPPAAQEPQPPHHSRPSRQRWWLIPAGIAAIIATVVAAMVIGGDTDGGERRAAPVPIAPASTSAASTGSPSTTVVARALPGTDPAAAAASTQLLAPSTPTGFAIATAERWSGRQPAREGLRQFWAASRDDPATSAWVLIDAGPDRSFTSGPSGSGRVALARGIGLVSRNSDGSTNLSGSIAGGFAVMSAGGLTTEDLVALMDSLEIADGDLQSPDRLVRDGWTLLASEHTDPREPVRPSAPIDDVQSTIVYADEGAEHWIQMVVNPDMSTYDMAVRTFFLRDQSVLTLGGIHTALVAIDGRPQSGVGVHAPLIRIDYGGVPVELTGTVPADVLLAVARTIAPIGDDRWTQMRDEASAYHDPTGTFAASITLGSGPLDPVDDSVGWQATFQSAGSPATTYVQTSDTPATSYAYQPLAPTGSIQSLAVPSFTALVANVDRSDVGAVLQVSAGDAHYEAPLVEVGRAAPSLFAVVVLTELGPYHAEIVGADGVVRSVLDG